MLKNNLELRDMDEKYRESQERLLADLLKAARVYGFIVDCATSDTVLYLRNKNGDSIGI